VCTMKHKAWLRSAGCWTELTENVMYVLQEAELIWQNMWPMFCGLLYGAIDYLEQDLRTLLNRTHRPVQNYILLMLTAGRLNLS
jgi:hypothetical protein